MKSFVSSNSKKPKRKRLPRRDKDPIKEAKRYADYISRCVDTLENIPLYMDSSACSIDPDFDQ